MAEPWQEDVGALEEEPARRPGRLRLFVLVLVLAGLAYGLWELRSLRAMLAELQTLRAQNAKLNTRLEALERRVGATGSPRSCGELRSLDETGAV